MSKMEEVEMETIPEIVIYFKKNDFEIRDLAVIAVEDKKHTVDAVGRKAIDYIKEHEEDSLFVPFKNGRISEVQAVVELVKLLIKENKMRSKFIFHPKMIVATPVKLNEVDRKAYEDMLLMISGKTGSVIDSSIESIKAYDNQKYDIAIGLIKNWVEEENTAEQKNSIVIYSEQGEKLLDEPLLMAVDKNTQKVAAIGNDAVNAKEIDNSNLEYISPFNNKKVAEFIYADTLIKYYLQKADSLVKRSIRKPNVILCNIPKNTTFVEKQAYINIFGQNGKSNIILAPFTFDELNQSLNEGNKLDRKIKFYIELN